MLAQRESLFRCTYSPASRSGTWTAHVAAWDAGEALQLFTAELRGEGVDEGGTIEVVALGAPGRTRRGPYRPSRH